MLNPKPDSRGTSPGMTAVVGQVFNNKTNNQEETPHGV
jgi:hypothetical protein